VPLRVLSIVILALLTLRILPTLQPPASNLLTQTRPSRWQVWTRALLMIRDYPFTGIGLDTFRLVAQNEYPYFNYAYNQTEHPHNLFLQAGADQGVLGLLALLWLIIAFYRTAARTPNTQYPISNIQYPTPGKSRHQSLVISHWSLSIGLLGGFTAFLIGSLFDNGVMTSHRTALVVWAVLGLQIARWRLETAHPTSHIANRKSRNTQHATRFTFHASRNTQHAILTSAIILLIIVGFPAYPIVASAYHDNLGCVERGRGWLWREASEEQRRAYARSALTHFQRALALWPGNAAAQRHLGTLYLHAQYPEEAVARLRGMPGAGYHPGFLAFYDEVAKLMGAEAPLPHLERAVALAPYDFLARFFLAEAYRADGRVAEAADQYAAAGVPVTWVLQEAGRRQRGNPSTEEAIVEYEIAAQLDSHNASCQVRLGDLYRDAGRAEEARAAYQAALVLQPDDEYIKRQIAELP
jgi:tetratricopeptide (TPR) repeat protein